MVSGLEMHWTHTTVLLTALNFSFVEYIAIHGERSQAGRTDGGDSMYTKKLDDDTSGPLAVKGRIYFCESNIGSLGRCVKVGQ